MAGCGPRLALRMVIALCAALALSAPAATSLAASPLKLQVAVGYHNQIKLGQWMPVSVDVTNDGANLDGTLEVESAGSPFGKGGPPVGTAVYQMPISLAAGATKHLQTYMSIDTQGPIDVRIVQNGRVVASQQSSPGTAAGLLVGVLSDQTTTLDQLGAIRPGGYAPTLSHLSVADLPDSSILLRAFDLLAIDDFSTDTLTAAQRSAVEDYVINGGSLFLGGGGSWHKTLSSLPSDLLPMNVSGSTLLTTGGLSGVEVATGDLNGSTAWMTAGSQPLLLEKHVGQGLVSMATFDWNQELIAGWTQSTTLLRQAFVRATYGMGANTNGQPGMITKFGFANSVATKGSQFSQALTNLPALSLPAWWMIGTLVFLYVMVVGPINYFVLRALNRRALAWITVPAIALLSSGCAYGASIATKGTAAQATQTSVVHVAAGEHAYVETYTGLLAPTRGDYDVALSGGHPLVSPIYTYYGQAPDPNQVSIRVNTVTDGINLPSMVAFTPRGFATEGMTDAPRVSATAALIAGNVTGTIQNQSQLNFTDGVVFMGNSFQKLAALPAGSSVSFTLAPSTGTPFSGPPAYMSIYPNAYSCCPPQQRNTQTDVEREAELRTAVLSTLPGSGFAGLAGAVPPAAVLWTKQPFQDITINGSHPQTFVESAVVVTVPIARVGAGQLASGVVMGRLIDIDGDFQLGGGPPGLLMSQSGSVVYEFTPNLIPGTHLTGAGINSASGQFSGKPAVGPGSSVQVVKGQVWDWTQSTWIDVTYNDTNLTTIPDSAVDTATGTVRMKISSEGPFSSGYLSLTGTVS